jgi:lipopolysaccharide transport system permease protein
MNPHAAHPISLRAMLGSVWNNRSLIWQMSKRDVMGRYKGSLMGLLWSFLNPLLMLLVYTFFFAVVFKSRWGVPAVAGAEETKTHFATILFAGMIVHSLFAEVLNRAPTLILSNINYVKKVVFPLEILPIISLVSAIFHALISMSVLLSVYLIFNGFLHWTIVFIPFVFLPFIILIAGLAWILASLGVYARDVGQTIGIAMTVMMFLSPVFYPISSLPEFMRPWMLANPLTFIIEQTRAVIIWGQLPHFRGLLAYSILATVVAWLGYVWFQKTRKGFADVL